MSLAQRPYGPGQNLPNVQSVIAQSVQGQGPGPLPASQVIEVTTEVLLTNPAQPTLALSCAIPPNTNLEQVPIDLNWSGDVETSESSNVTFKVYFGTDLNAGVLIGSSGALAFPTGGGHGSFWAAAKMIFDSLAGTLDGKIEFFANHHLVAAVVLSNVTEIPAISNTSDPVAQFCVSVQASAASADDPVTVNTQNLSVG